MLDYVSHKKFSSNMVSDYILWSCDSTYATFGS